MVIPRGVYTDEGAEFIGSVNGFFKGVGIQHITTVTYAPFVERFIRTIKHGLRDRVRFNNSLWEEMVNYVIDKYNTAVPTSTGYKPKAAADDKHAVDINNKSEMDARTARHLPYLSISDSVKMFKTPGTYGECRESNSRWTDEVYKVIDIETQHHKCYTLDGKNKPCIRHERLLVT